MRDRLSERNDREREMGILGRREGTNDLFEPPPRQLRYAPLCEEEDDPAAERVFIEQVGSLWGDWPYADEGRQA